MADDKGILIASNIIPAFDDGVVRSHATHIAKYGKGGWREVATIAERDAITSERREAGMSVYVTSEKKLYILNADLTTWTLFSAGGVTDMPEPAEKELGNIVQYIGPTTENYIQGYFYKCISNGADPAVYSWERIDVQPNTAVWGSITGTLADQTDLNNELTHLQTEIDSLSGRGRYLSIWDCTTGLAETNPPESPYTYKAGDYFIVGKVAEEESSDESGEYAINYKPDGTSYVIGVPSTTIETDEVNIDDTYIYDGTTWHLQYNSQKTVTFGGIVGDPYDNTELGAALDTKVEDVRLNDVSVVTDKIANIIVDSEVTEDSTNLITSGGVFNAITEATPTYTADEPSTVEVGGFPINSKPENMTFAEFADKLLHKYVAPTNSLVINPSTSPRQLGTILDVTGTSTVTRKATSDYSLTKLVFYLNGTAKETITEGINVKTGSFAYTFADAGTTTNTKYFKQTFKTTLTDSYGSNVSSEKSIDFVAPTFYGKVRIPGEYDDTPAHVKAYLQANIETILSNLTKSCTVSSTIDNVCSLNTEHYIFVTPFTWTTPSGAVSGTKKIYEVGANADYTDSTSIFTHSHTENGVTTTYNVYYLTDQSGDGTKNFTFKLTVKPQEG